MRARELVGDEPFALLLPDVLVQNQGKGCLAQMLDVYAHHGGNILAVEPVPEAELKNYGVVSIGKGNGRVFPYRRHGREARSQEPRLPNLTILGRYILQPEIFDLLSAQETGAGGEIQITDAMQQAHGSTQPFHALKYEGRTFDCGSKLGFLTRQCRLWRSSARTSGDAFDRRDQEAALSSRISHQRLSFTP